MLAQKIREGAEMITLTPGNWGMILIHDYIEGEDRYTYEIGEGCALTAAAVACTADLKQQDPVKWDDLWSSHGNARSEEQIEWDLIENVLQTACSETYRDVMQEAPQWLTHAINDYEWSHTYAGEAAKKEHQDEYKDVSNAVMFMFDTWKLSALEIADLLEAWGLG